MTTREQLILATTVASRAHKHQKRKDGTPYLGHCAQVVARVAPDMHLMIAAWLHDVVEDTRDTPYEVTLVDLRGMGFEDKVIRIVDHVTRRPGETYSDFIDRCAQDEEAKILKCADIDHNLHDQSSLEPEEAEFLRNRYEKALKRLQ